MIVVSHSPAATAWLDAFGVASVAAHGHGRTDVLVVEGRPSEGGPEALESRSPGGETVTFEGRTLKEVLGAALRLARAVEVLPAAMAYLAEAERRLGTLHERIGRRRRGDPASRPRVACLTGLGPVRVGGWWIPDLIDQAGGYDVLGTRGMPPRTVEARTLAAADPDVVLVVDAALGDEPARRREWGPLLRLLRAHTPRAVAAGCVFGLDSRYVSLPGPALYRGIELIAAAIHPAAGVITRPQELWPLGGEPASSP